LTGRDSFADLIVVLKGTERHEIDADAHKPAEEIQQPSGLVVQPGRPEGGTGESQKWRVGPTPFVFVDQSPFEKGVQH
jgi:hypothetical protein